MPRRVLSVVVGLAALASVFAADEGIQRGKIRKVDPDKGVVTLVTADGKEVEAAVTDTTQIRDGQNNPVKDRLKDKALREGAPVMFKVTTKDGKATLVGLRLIDAGPAIEKVDTSKLKPLTELGTGEYHGYKGGLYPDGKNERPAAHEKAGLARARLVRPRDADGKPDADGKIVLLSVGMSNTTQEFSTFMKLAEDDAAKNPKLVLVDGAQGGMTAARIKDAEGKDGGAKFWTTVDERLKAAGVTRAQVQVVWIKEADAGPTQGFPKYARTLQAELKQIVQLIHTRFPNVQLAYLSSRTYGGYATTRLNPEPYAYESGFSVKWLIEEQIKGDKELNYDADKGEVKAPWLSWGPYLWANGSKKRADGFSYEESDFGPDGTHPTMSGRRKVAKLLLEFFKTDSTAKTWFVKADGKEERARLIPLTDMGKDETYHGYKGGLYPDGRNERPAAHEKAGVALAKRIRPLDAAGKPSADGKIVLLSIGFSNTVQCFAGLMQAAEKDKEINPQLVLVNGAQGGRSAFMIKDPDDGSIGEQYWKTWVPDRLKARGVTAEQVQVVWLKETDASLGPAVLKQMGLEKYDSPLRQGFPKGARTLQGELKKIVRVIHRRFPNVRLVYLSSRSYGGWAKREGNKEPWSYETGFAVKWLIQEQLDGDKELNYDPGKGEVKAPWLSWGPYFWADGEKKRKDGFAIEPDDFREDDRMHHSPQGQQKIGRLLLRFFKSDPTTRPWFVKTGAGEG